MFKGSHCASIVQLKQAILLLPTMLDCSLVGKIHNADKGISNNVGTLQLAGFSGFFQLFWPEIQGRIWWRNWLWIQNIKLWSLHFRALLMLAPVILTKLKPEKKTNGPVLQFSPFSASKWQNFKMAFSSVSSITLASRLQIHAHKSHGTHSELTVYTLASSASLECWSWVTTGRFTTLHRFQRSLPAVRAPLKERVASSVGFAAKMATAELPFGWISSLWCHVAVLKSQLFNAGRREFKIAASYLDTSRFLPS